ncbi:MAG TPA: Ig-like domain-containing protein, partial [Gemmatimonadaceae bacterium]|nr:Ig-like domain-containing protein [Gemmatimonadaceae bacterium]
VGANGETPTPLIAAVIPGTTRVRAFNSRRLCIGSRCSTSRTDYGSFDVTVINPPVASVAVDPATSTIAPGSTTQLTAVLKDAKGNVLTGRTVTWSSSNEAVAKVDGAGLVTTVGTGSATITATSEDKTGTATVTVGVLDPNAYTLSFSAGAVNSGVENIYMQTTGSADATRVALTTGAFDDQSGHWSRNGSRLLLTSNRSGGGAWELYMLDAASGGTPRRISTAGGLTGYGDLSWVDPSTAVFMRGYRIWTMNVDAPNPDATAVQITSTPFDENEPKYSPNGQWITWVRQPRAGTDVWVMNANDPSQAFQVTDLGDYARNPSWSPDSRKIVFSRKYDIYIADVIDPSTGRVRALADVRITRLTFDGSWNDTPVWSPDGRKIVWSAEPAAARGQTDLMMMNADGTGAPERITFTTGINEAWPAFRPRLCDVFADPNCNPAAP